jgi:MinD-like ATPase involved in chromosome partitioning or flagellar assembly
MTQSLAPESAVPEPAIALVFSPETWVEDLHRHLADHGGARVRQIVLEPSVAVEEEYDTLVVSDRWTALSRSLVEELHRRGRTVLGVHDPDETAGATHLLSLGVDVVISSTAAPAEFVAALSALGRAISHAARHRSELALVGPSPASVPASASPIVVLAGPPGGGATEVAIELARAAAVQGHRVVLVDADGQRPSIAARLAFPVEPGLRAAVDTAEHGDGDLSHVIRASAVDRLGVVCGFAGTADARHARSSEVVRVVEQLAALTTLVVADCASASTDGFTPAVLDAAGAVVGVGAGTPVGVARLLAWIADARVAAERIPMHLVVNVAPADRFRRREIAHEIARTFEPASLAFVPFDRRVDAAAWEGALVASGGFTQAVGVLAQHVVPPAPAVRSRRRGVARRAARSTAGRMARADAR